MGSAYISFLISSWVVAGPPVMLGEATLGFCGNSGVSCCDDADDAALRQEFEAMVNGSKAVDAACATIAKAALCSKCSPSLLDGSFNTNASSTTITKSSLSLLCAGATPPSISSSHCHPNTSSGLPQPDMLCLEKISEGSYLSMAVHPDGSDRIFLTTKDGVIWLASLPARGSQGTMQLNDTARPFLDLRDRVQGPGIVGIAFHPMFTTNGRFFVSYTFDCSSTQTSGANWRPAGAAATNGSPPYQCQLDVSEFSAKDGVNDFVMAHGDPSKERRIFTMGLPLQAYSSYPQHGGQILFRPSDGGYLYLITGHTGDEIPKFDSPQDKRSLLGNVVMFDVNQLPGEIRGGSSRDGRDSTPNMATPRIFATGLSYPNGCSFDSERPSNLYCANVNQGQSEELLLISKGVNCSGSTGVAFHPIVSQDRPMGGRTPTIIGGLIYHGSADPSLEGRYLYMYGSAAWIAEENPVGSGRYATAQITNIKCSSTTPFACHYGGISGRVLSMSEDNRRDALVIAIEGMYRVVQPGLCATPELQRSVEPARSSAWLLWFLGFSTVLGIIMVCSNMLCGQGQPLANCNEWCGCSIICCLNVRNMINGPTASHGGVEAGA